MSNLVLNYRIVKFGTMSHFTPQLKYHHIWLICFTSLQKHDLIYIKHDALMQNRDPENQ
jgi:hypothetical protein